MSPTEVAHGVYHEAAPCAVCGCGRTTLFVASHTTTSLVEKQSPARPSKTTAVEVALAMPPLNATICPICDGITWQEEAHDV